MTDVVQESTAKDVEEQEGITVAIRMRPLNKNEGDRERMWKVLPKYHSITQTTKEGKPLPERVTGRTFFTFDKVFGEDTNTTQVYNDCAKGIVSSVVNGLNGTIFAYGQTSSGKTFTMQGSGSIEEGSRSLGGVVHMAARDIFEHIQSQPDRMFLVRASFLEIYNEEVRDLLSSSHNTLQIREDPRRGVFVQSVEEMVTDFESLLKILFFGEKLRAVAATGMNERSSRSHTIFKITIESREKEQEESNDDGNNASAGDGAVRISTLNLVDLAGSESVRHTGATGDRQKEGGMINQSLLTLSRVIVGLGSSNQTHINFRDSKLTRILQPSLSGNARMAVICCATPSELYLEETRSTLQFASRAKLVKTNAQVNEVLDDRSIIRRLQRELAQARRQVSGPGCDEVRHLENKATAAGNEAIEAKEKLDRLKSSILNAGRLFESESDGADYQATATCNELRSKKRRQSDGGELLSYKSPSKQAHETKLPRTAPRKKKSVETNNFVLSPSSELNIVREALSVRSELARNLQETVAEHHHLIRIKEEELDRAVCEQDGLQEEHSQSLDEIEKLRSEVMALRTEFESTLLTHSEILDEKEKVIAESVAKLKQESEQKSRVESTLQEFVQSAESEKAGLQQQNLASLQQNEDLLRRYESAQTDHSQLELELEKLTKEKAEDKLKLDEQSTQIDNLVSSVDLKQVELSDAQGRAELLQENLDSADKKVTEQQLLVSSLQERLQSMEESEQQSQTNWTAAEVGLKEEKASIEGELQDAHNELSVLKENNTALNSSVAEVQEALSVSQVQNEELQASLEVLSSEKEDVSREADEAKATIGLLEKEKEDLYQRIQNCEADLTLSEETICQTKQENQELQENHQELEKKLSEEKNAKAELSSAFDKIIEEKEMLARQSNSFGEQLALGVEERKQMAGLIDELRSNKDDLDGKLSGAEQEVARLNENLSRGTSENEKIVISLREVNHSQTIQVDALSSRCEELDSVAANQTNEIARLGEELRSVSQQKATLEQDHSQSGNKVALLQAEVDKVTMSLEQVQDEMLQVTESKYTAEGLLTGLQESAYLLEEDLAKAEEELVGVRMQSEQSIIALQEELEEHQQAFETLSASKETALRSQEETEERVQTLQDSLDTLEEQNRELLEKFDELSEEKLELVGKIDHYEVERVEFQSEIMSIKAESMASLAEKDSLETNQSEALEELESQLNASKARSDDLLKQKAEAERLWKEEQAEKVDELDRLKSSHTEIQAALQDRDQEKQQLKEECSISQTKLQESLAKSQDLEERIAAQESEILGLRSQLESRDQNANAALDLCKKQEEMQIEMDDLTRLLAQSRAELEQANASKDSLSKSLREREEERNEAAAALEQQYKENRELNANALKALPKEKEKQLLAELSDLQSSNMELTQLLASSNETVERSRNELSDAEQEITNKTRALEDAEYRYSQLEEELRCSEQKESVNQEDESVRGARILLLEQEKTELERQLNTTQEQQFEREAELKRRMGTEQRVLLHEGEKMMTTLKERVDELENKLSQSETEAYTARQRVEELVDQKENVYQQHSQTADVVEEITKKSTEQAQQIAALEVELNKAKAECYSLKETTIDLKEKSRRATRDSEKVSREKGVISSELSTLKRKISAIERSSTDMKDENTQLKNEIHGLNSQDRSSSTVVDGLQLDLKEKMSQIASLEMLVADLKTEKMKSARMTTRSSGQGSDEISRLTGELKQLKEIISQKDDRIKKLKPLTLTKEQAASIRKTKADNVKFDKQCTALKKENVSLKSQLSSLNTESTLAEEITELKFDKNALETKLRKYATYTQHQEDCRVSIRNALQSCGISVSPKEDMVDRVVELCDKVTSMEGSSYGVVDQLEGANQQLAERVSCLEQKEHQLTNEVDEYKIQLEDLKMKYKSTRHKDDTKSDNDESARKLGFLEQENLQLMMDVKSTKRQLQAAREELEMVKVNAVDHSTMDFSTVETTDWDNLLKLENQSMSREDTSGSKRSRKSLALVDKSNIVDKENAVHTASKKPRGLPPRKSTRNSSRIAALPKKSPGLGEAATVQGDDTAECKQS